MFFQCFYSIGSHVLSWLTDGSKELGNNLFFNYFSIFILLLAAFQLNKIVQKLVGLPSYRSQYIEKQAMPGDDQQPNMTPQKDVVKTN